MSLTNSRQHCTWGFFFFWFKLCRVQDVLDLLQAFFMVFSMVCDQLVHVGSSGILCELQQLAHSMVYL